MLFSPLVEHAIEIAAEWHDGTYRKGRWSEPVVEVPGIVPGVPAMAHVSTVALTVSQAGWGEEAVAAAFLHDALEDRNREGEWLGRDRLAALVGEGVVRIVEAVSEPKAGPDGAMLPWRERKEAYLDALGAGPPEASGVSLADKLHNAYSMAETAERGIDLFRGAPGRRALSAGPEDQLWFFRATLETTERHDDPRLAPQRARLREEVARLARAFGR